MTDRNQARYVAARPRSGNGWTVEDVVTTEKVASFPIGDDPAEAMRLATQVADELNDREERR